MLALRLALLTSAWCLTGCLSLAPKRTLTRREQVVAGSAGLALATGALIGAERLHHAPIAVQSASAITASVIPVSVLYLGQDDDPGTTVGGIYSSLGRRTLAAFGASLSMFIPVVATIATGSDVMAPRGALYATVGGMFVGSATTYYLNDHLPRWACVAVGALVIGASTTLGYQLGGGGAPE